MKKHLIFLAIGVLLIALSSPPLFKMGKEYAYQADVEKNFDIKEVYHAQDFVDNEFNQMFYSEDGQMIPHKNISRKVLINGVEVDNEPDYSFHLKQEEENELERIIQFYDTEIVLRDTFTATQDAEAREMGEVELLINGENYAVSTPIEIRTSSLDNNRYHGFVGLVSKYNRFTQEDELVVVKRLFTDDLLTNEEEYSWETLTINERGEVVKDMFTRTELNDPAYRTEVINKAGASPIRLGYESDILHYYPTFIFPLLYPFFSGLIGAVFIILGLIFAVRRKRNSY